VKTQRLLTGTNPPEFLALDQITERARRSDYQARKLAYDLGLSSKTFARRFHQAFGSAPRDWLAEQRLDDGLALLERGLSTKEVAAELGFRDRSSLFRVFRLRLNHTPRKVVNRIYPALPAIPVICQPAITVSELATFLSESATPPDLRLSLPL